MSTEIAGSPAASASFTCSVDVLELGVAVGMVRPLAGLPIGLQAVSEVAHAAENKKFTKERARGRIDGAVAAAIAIGRYLAGDTGASVYESDARPDGFLFM